MNASLRQRRALPAVVAVSLACTAIGIGTTIAAQPAQAVPSVGPNVSPTMFTGNRGTGCTYNVSVVVTDHTAPVQLLIVDEHGQVVSRLATRNERRTDQKRVVELYESIADDLVRRHEADCAVPGHVGIQHRIGVLRGLADGVGPHPTHFVSTRRIASRSGGTTHRS